MDAETLKTLQAPLKEQYATNPASALVTLSSTSTLDEGISCKLATGTAAKAIAGLHPMAGGAGDQLCSGDLLLEALVACTGVTLRAVSTALDIPIASGTITAEGDLDFRGTLGVDKTIPVGFKAIRLKFDLDTGDAPKEKVGLLLKLTERYCVVLQTLKGDAVRPACGACQRTAKFKLRDPKAVVCKYPKRKEPRRLVVKTAAMSALPHDEQHVDFPVMTSPASYSSASPAPSHFSTDPDAADSAEAYPSPPQTFALPSLPPSAEHSPLQTPPDDSIAPVQVPPLYYLSDLGAAFIAPELSRMPSALPESRLDWPQDLWAESTGLVFDDGYGFEHKRWEVSEIEGELEATLEEWERDHACGQGDPCGELCVGSEGPFPWR